MMKTAVDIREEAAERFEALGFPTTRQEEWKYTNVAPIARIQWSAARPRAAAAAEAAAATQADLTFINGHLAHRNERKIPGLRILPISEAGEYYGQIADWQRNPFTALNIAKSEDGAFIICDAPVEGFVHLLFVGEGDEIWSHPHNVIVAGG